MSTAVQITASVVLVLGGLAILITGWRGLRGTLPPNRFVGVRTSATMNSDEAYRAGNRAAGPATIAGGAVALLVGACMPAVSGLVSAIVLVVLGLVGTVLLMGIGGVIGHRTAEALTESLSGSPCGSGSGAAESDSCSGCSGGCRSLLGQQG